MRSTPSLLSLRGSEGTLPHAPASSRQWLPCQPLSAVSAHSAPSPSRDYQEKADVDMNEVSGQGLVAVAGPTGRAGSVIVDGLSHAGAAGRSLSRPPSDPSTARAPTTSLQID